MFLVMTYGEPESRTMHLDHEGWTVTHNLIERNDNNEDAKDNPSHLYIMRKQGSSA